MARYAIVNSGLVTNIVMWDGEENCSAIPADAIRVSDSQFVGPGFTYDGVNFTPPPEQIPRIWPSQP